MKGAPYTLTAHAHPGKNEPIWFLFYFYLLVIKKPEFDPLSLFCHFCLHPLQNAMKENPLTELQPIFPPIRTSKRFSALFFQTRHEVIRPCHRSYAWRHPAVMDCAVPVPGSVTLPMDAHDA